MRTRSSVVLMLEWLAIYLRYTGVFAALLLLAALALAAPLTAALLVLPVVAAALLGAGAGLGWSWARRITRALGEPPRRRG